MYRYYSSFTDLTGYIHREPKSVNYQHNYRKTESCSTFLTRSGFIYHIESFLHARQLILGDSDAVILGDKRIKILRLGCLVFLLWNRHGLIFN